MAAAPGSFSLPRNHCPETGSGEMASRDNRSIVQGVKQVCGGRAAAAGCRSVRNLIRALFAFTSGARLRSICVELSVSQPTGRRRRNNQLAYLKVLPNCAPIIKVELQPEAIRYTRTISVELRVLVISTPIIVRESLPQFPMCAWISCSTNIHTHAAGCNARARCRRAGSASRKYLLPGKVRRSARAGGEFYAKYGLIPWPNTFRFLKHGLLEIYYLRSILQEVGNDFNLPPADFSPLRVRGRSTLPQSC